MKIYSIEFRNFSSYGNNLQKIVFNDQTGNFYLVVGQNGAGKSTVSDVIKFGLYGKVDSKNLRDIPNRFNGNAYVKILLEKTPGTLVTIERGLAPNVFRLYINGIEYDQAGKKNMQDYLEEEILGIPYYVFNNMISLSINDFKSFISMKVHDKRMIIDRLFGLEIIGSIKWKVRNQLKMLKDNADLIMTEVSVLERSIKKSQEELESLQEKLKTASEERLVNLDETKEKLLTFISKAELQIEKIKNKDKELEESVTAWQKKGYEVDKECEYRSKKIELYQNGKCPTCENDLTTDFYQHLLYDYLEKNEEAKADVTEINNTVESFIEKRKSLKALYETTHAKLISASTQLAQVKVEIGKIVTANGIDDQTESLDNIIKDSENKKNVAAKRKEIEEKKSTFYKIVEEIFGDKGIKLEAIKKILPILNFEIKKILLDVNLDYRVTFNEEFEADIQHLGFKISPEQLSTGERKKVDFAVLIALIRLMKMKFSGVNLIFLDEIFSSIDSDGIHHILKVLNETCKELNINIFVINHSQLPTEIFDFRIDISKNNGFSNLVLEKID